MENEEARDELKKLIEKAIDDPNFKKELLDFADRLSNGKLDKFLEDMKKRIKNDP